MSREPHSIPLAEPAFTLARYLPNIPYANRLVLTPPGERPEEIASEPAPSHHPELAALLGRSGSVVAELLLKPPTWPSPARPTGL